ncbi:DNA replication protein SLD5 [Sporobolomyces salmoneus]|uniref:DNA replication protein SLD5 n=1 Tax=Sporobolomyces salmoneus TaxID=183962 RepID=UPI00317DBB58
MSKPRGGFFDDDDDDEDQQSILQETSESYDTSNYGGGRRGGGAIDDSLSSTGFPSPRRYQNGGSGSSENGAAAPRPGGGGGGRASSITTAGRTGGALAGSSTRDYDASTTRGGSPTLDDILGTDGDVSNERNVQRLLRAWHNEMGAPELLVFPRRLVDKLVRDLARRKAIVRQAQSTRGKDEAFYTSVAIVATENMRAAHVLKMYTRERLYKLEQCAQYYLSLPDVEERLYENEIAHAEGYVRLVKAYHDAAAMDAMPDQSNRHPPPMPEPDFSKPVFFRALQDCPPVILPDGEPFVFEKGSQHMCRYSTIRALLEQDAVELI